MRDTRFRFVRVGTSERFAYLAPLSAVTFRFRIFLFVIYVLCGEFFLLVAASFMVKLSL